jgi:endo-1,4-beta-xylanase
MRRRDFLTALNAGLLAAALPAAAEGQEGWKIPFGAAVQDGALRDDARYREALAEHCQLLVGEGGLKWFDLRPEPHIFNFEQPDRLLAFASENGMRMRGHTLVWYAAMPDWALAISTEAEAEREMIHHITAVMSRYRGRIPSWDAVNEPTAENPLQSGPLRESVWNATLGPRYIDLALRTAAEVDPEAQLVINEYDIEMHDPAQRAKREALLDTIRGLKDRDVPLHAVGFQGHLRSGMEIDREGVAAFAAEIAAMDIDVLVTEMDVIDNEMPGPEPERDEAVARLAGDFLSAITDGSPLSAIMTWGISDRYTWVPIWFTRNDGRPNRPLPLDENYERKALMDVIDCFRR